MKSNFTVFDAHSIEINDWNYYLTQKAHSTVFHTRYAFDVYSSSNEYKPFAFFIKDSNAIVAMLAGIIHTVDKGVASHLTKRAIIMQTPLYDNNDSLDALLEYYCNVIKGRVVYSEIRNHIIDVTSNSTYSKYQFYRQDHLDIFLNVSQDLDLIFGQMESGRRKQINRGFKRGLTVVEVSNQDSESLLTCYEIICKLYRRIALPPPKWSLINSAMILSDSNSGAKCFAAIYDGKIVGTRIVLYAKQAIFDWYAASKEEFYHLYPNDVLPWEVMKWGHDHGFTTFDFGGAGKPGVKYGVRDYKMKFGGELVNTGRMIRIHRPVNYYIATMAFTILQKLRKRK